MTIRHLSSLNKDKAGFSLAPNDYKNSRLTRLCQPRVCVKFESNVSHALSVIKLTLCIELEIRFTHVVQEIVQMNRACAGKVGAGRIGLATRILLFILLMTPLVSVAEPPWSGTVFIDPDIITESDPTTFVDSVHTGTGSRTMFDRRVNDWVQLDAILFEATYSDGFTIEFQVNPEFGSVEAARVQADFYAEIIGRLPLALRSEVHSSSIHRGDEAFGGGALAAPGAAPLAVREPQPKPHFGETSLNKLKPD